MTDQIKISYFIANLDESEWKIHVQRTDPTTWEEIDTLVTSEMRVGKWLEKIDGKEDKDDEEDKNDVLDLGNSGKL